PARPGRSCASPWPVNHPPATPRKSKSCWLKPEVSPHRFPRCCRLDRPPVNSVLRPAHLDLAVPIAGLELSAVTGSMSSPKWVPVRGNSPFQFPPEPSKWRSIIVYIGAARLQRALQSSHLAPCFLEAYGVRMLLRARRDRDRRIGS